MRLPLSGEPEDGKEKNPYVNKPVQKKSLRIHKGKRKDQKLSIKGVINMC